MKRLPIILTLLASASAAAQPAGAQAEVLFRQGRALLDAGKLAEACAAFDQSQRLEPALTTLINLASCREQNGQLATAWGLFLDAERQTRSSTEPASQQLHGVAAEHAAKLESRVSKLAIDVPQASQVDGLEIDREGDRVDAAMWNRALPIDPGTYTIHAHAPGTSTWSTKITIAAEAETKTVDIPDMRTLPRDLAVVLAEPRSKLLPIIVGSGAIALFGGALGFDLWGNSTYNAAKAEQVDQARRTSLETSANHKRYAAESLALGGIAAAGVAVWLYLRGADEHASPQTAHLAISPSGIAITGGF
ncbi:MAG TPA: hypothetical protein VF403_15600 [Kofleriaceae bacterium]